MRKCKTCLISLLLALVMSCSLAVTAFAAGNAGFSDVKTTAWYYSDVTECAKLGAVAGFEDGTFKPEDQVTGVQFVTMMARTFYNDKVEEAQKSKPAGTPWYWANLKVAEDVGMSKGLKAVDDSAMNRYEMAVALANTAVNNGKHLTTEQGLATIATIKEYAQIPSNYRSSVMTCYGLGIISGMADGEFHGEESMTRAQACTVIMRMFKLINGDHPNDNNNQDQNNHQNPDTGNNNQNPPAQTTGKLANGQDATVANVEAILAELKQEYPDGMSWGDPNKVGETNYYNHTCGSTHDVKKLMNSAGAAIVNLKYGCGGFAAMVSERIFGETGAPAREITEVSKLRPGDIIIKYSKDGTPSHVAIVERVGKNPDQNNEWRYGTCDGNINGHVAWSYTKQPPAGKLGTMYSGGTVRAFTRYPENESEMERVIP